MYYTPRKGVKKGVFGKRYAFSNQVVLHTGVKKYEQTANGGGVCGIIALKMQLNEVLQMKKGKKSATLLLLIAFSMSLLLACAPKTEEKSTAVDAETQRAQFEQMAQNRLIEETEGVTKNTSLETAGNMLISADCPEVSQNTSVSSELAAYVNQELETFRGEASNMGAPDENLGLYHFTLTYKPFRVGSDLLGIKFTETAYSGKTDKKNEIASFVYNLQSAQRLGPDDVFDTAQDYLPIVANKVRESLLRNEIVQKNMDESLFEQGTAATQQNYSNFVITPENKIIFYFNKGMVAPAEAGTIEVCIPMAELDAIINPANREFLYGGGAMPVAPGEEQTDVQQGSDAADTWNITPLPQLYMDDTFMQPQSLSGIDPLADKVVALTFDDGPSAYTEQLLDILKDNDVNATFFLVGENVVKHKDVVKRMYDEGNEIGGHSWDHTSNFLKWSLDQVKEQTVKTNDAIAEITGKRSFMDRPPEGAINEEVAQKIGREQIMWDVDPEDWKPANRDPDTVYNNVVNADQLRDGSIILLHDIRETSVQAVDRIIKELKSQGYKFVTASQMIQIAQVRGKNVEFVFNCAPTAAEATATAAADTSADAAAQSTQKPKSTDAPKENSAEGEDSSSNENDENGNGDSGGDLEESVSETESGADSSQG